MTSLNCRIPLLVVLDACVLVPYNTCDVFLTLAEFGIIDVAWSQEILTETERTLVSKLNIPVAKANKRIQAMQKAFPEASIQGLNELTPTMTNHYKDRHVLACAIRAEADYLITANVKDFPPESYSDYELIVEDPDIFLVKLLASDEVQVQQAIAVLRSRRADKARSAVDVLALLDKTLPRFADALESVERASRAYENEDLPLPVSSASEEDALDAMLSESIKGKKSTPQLTVLQWLAALDDEDYQTALDLCSDGWDSPQLKTCREYVSTRSLASKVHYHPRIDSVAYMKLIPNQQSTVRAFATSHHIRVSVITLVRKEDLWVVWGLDGSAVPTSETVLGPGMGGDDDPVELM